MSNLGLGNDVPEFQQPKIFSLSSFGGPIPLTKTVAFN